MQFKPVLLKPEIAANMTTETRDCPLYSGGASLLYLSYYQGTSCTAMIVVQQTDTEKKIIKAMYEDLVLETGLYGPLWEILVKNISAWVSKHQCVIPASTMMTKKL